MNWLNSITNFRIWYPLPVSWLSGNAFGSGAGSMRIKSRANQIGVLPKARHRCNISSKGAVLPGTMTWRWASPTRYTLRRKTASIIKDLIWFPLPIFSNGKSYIDLLWQPSRLADNAIATVITQPVKSNKRAGKSPVLFHYVLSLFLFNPKFFVGFAEAATQA